MIHLCIQVHCAKCVSVHVVAFLTSPDDTMATYVTTKEDHTHGEGGNLCTPQDNLCNIWGVWIFLQSIEYFMVDWRVDLWAVTHGGLTVILLI